MQYTIKTSIILLAMSLGSGCGNSEPETPAASPDAVDLSTDAPVVTFEPDNAIVGQPTGPVTLAYRIIGKPVVGQPVAIEMRFESTASNQPVKVAYRVVDATALRLGESQPVSVTVAPSDEVGGGTERVTVIPLREGRLFLNVSATIEAGDGSTGTVTAIPIQVGN